MASDSLASLTAHLALANAWVSEWELGAGLTASLDSVTRQSSIGAATRYDSAGVRGFVGALVFTANHTRRSTGGSLSQLGVKTRLGGLAIDVTLRSKERKRGIGNVLLELVSRADGSERVVAPVHSSADGYFIVQAVLPGSYALRVAAQQLDELKLADPVPRAVQISVKGNQVNGQNFTLAPR